LRLFAAFHSHQYKLAQTDPTAIWTGLYENCFNSKNKQGVPAGERQKHHLPPTADGARDGDAVVNQALLARIDGWFSS
jgi:hypothetical protein